MQRKDWNYYRNLIKTLESHLLDCKGLAYSDIAFQEKLDKKYFNLKFPNPLERFLKESEGNSTEDFNGLISYDKGIKILCNCIIVCQ